MVKVLRWTRHLIPYNRKEGARTARRALLDGKEREKERERILIESMIQLVTHHVKSNDRLRQTVCWRRGVQYK